MISRLISQGGLRFMSASAGKRVGFIGMGNMGLPMATNLAKAGFHVKGFDKSLADESKLKAVKDAGIVPQANVSSTCKEVDYIVTSLPATQNVEEVLMADDGILNSASEGTVICDVSTISPIASGEFADAARKKGMTFVDSPMSGGVAGATAGTLTFMVGSHSEEEFEAASVVLAAMGKKIFNCGKPGTGEVAKIVNNMILGTHMTAVAEGMALGEKLGIDPKKLQEILSVSTGACWANNVNNPRPGVLENAPSSRNYEGGFMLALMRKDMTLALELVEKVNGSAEMAEKSMAYYLELEKKGHGGKDFGYVYQYISKNKKLNGKH